MIDVLTKEKYKIKLSKDDISWIEKEYPSLKVQNDIIKGEICFHRAFNNIPILDCFNIKIILKTNEKSMLPKVICIDNRIKNISAKLNLPLDKLHINSDNSFCLTLYLNEKNFFTNGKFNIKEFFKNLLEPYLYWLSFYEKFQSPPWGEYSHGTLGVLEYIGENDLSIKEIFKIIRENNMDIRKILATYRQNFCICGYYKKYDDYKNKKIRNCHPNVWKGIKKIKTAICQEIKNKKIKRITNEKT